MLGHKDHGQCKHGTKGSVIDDRINFIIVNYNKCVLSERESENERRRNMRRM